MRFVVSPEFVGMLNRWTILFRGTAFMMSLSSWISAGSRLFYLVLTVLCAVCQGCGSNNETSRPLRPDQNVVQRANHLQLAIQRLAMLGSFDNSAGHRQVLYHLNQWMGEERPNPPWSASKLFDELPERFKPLQTAADGSSTLLQEKFAEFDVSVLQEALWFQRAARDLVKPERDTTPIRLWTTQGETARDDPNAQALRRAIQLFDWTVRTVRLDSLADTPPSKASARTPVAGSKHYPWEAALIGHGDAYLRMRIFILLCQQVELESVVLAVDNEGEQEPTPWVVAVLIGDDAYLFDASLGIPIPGSGGQGVATLKQVMDDTSLLRQLDIEGHRYPMRRSKFDRLVGLVDGTLTSLSRRMKAIEAHLRGTDRLGLTRDADGLARRVAQELGVQDVRLWHVPYDVYLYKQSLRGDAEAARSAALEYNTIHVYPPLATGRLLHIVGQRIGGDYGMNAASHYLQCRVPDWELEQLSDPNAAENLEQKFGKLPEDPVIRNSYMRQIRSSMTTVKTLATLWLGQMVFENGEYKVSTNYLRELSDSEESAWITEAARYNLARALEARAIEQQDRTVLEQAIATYLEDTESPQSIGNRLRARWLEERADELVGGDEN